MGKMTVYTESYGCSASLSDGEIMAGILVGAGLEPVAKPELADIIIVNTCYVKQKTEQRILSRLREICEKWPEKRLIITGCIPQAAPEKISRAAPGASLVSSHRISEIDKAVRKAFEGKRVVFLGRSGAEKANLPKIRKNPLVDIIQISSGCLGNCSYCGTKLAKGSLISYLPERIVSEVKCAKAQGCKEFWLTGQDIGCYGFDIGTGLPELLRQVLEVKGQYLLRLGMMNPAHLEKILGPLLDTCEDGRVCKFFHIPVQAGSDGVLKDMKRGYSVEDFERQVQKIREKFGDFATIGTDIIVGYPTETEEDFEQTLGLLE
ncbi:MAG: tRNA (N(6)-L-threonylcarbamoyladenosine(37)-C(2))-methylthiotransferase, partial [Candidatus Aenigmatarchaeota archaeon]